MEQNKQVIVISGINLFEGGPLSVYKDCLRFLNDSLYIEDYRVVALVHKTILFNQKEFKNIEFMEFPKSRTSYFYRLYYEYIHFRSIADRFNIKVWLSLHDISPNLGAVRQAVYCHNPSPFDRVGWSGLFKQPTRFLFNRFYKFLYRINIHSNVFVVVQQKWIKDEFVEMFGLKADQVIIAPPKMPENLFRDQQLPAGINSSDGVTFFYPAFPRPFKNFEVIAEAIRILEQNSALKFTVYLTLDGKENGYSNNLMQKYGNLKNVRYTGILSREVVYSYYQHMDYLIFPSKLETWGLPISEFKQFEKPMLVANLPYAKETVGKYGQIKFFNPDNPVELAAYMEKIILGVPPDFDATADINYDAPVAKSWKSLFNYLIEVN